VGLSPRIRQIHQLILKAGRSKSSVLILGETGTGKEIVARLIHAVRSEGLFVPIDCSAMAGPLIESELFGHTRGAFTGAVGSKPGLVEIANGGSAFFDEIAELPVEYQAKLLRVFQEKEFRPVGSVATRRSDFRVIAATNQDLMRAVERGTFRRDLYYRLNVLTLRLPPLRERKEDIPLLIDYFLKRWGSVHSITHECLQAMLLHDWQGNVRELENAVQRMVALNSGPLLHTADLPSAVLATLEARRTESLSMCAAAAQAPDLARAIPAQPAPVPSMTEMEKQNIRQALEYTKGDRVRAANLLGIGRTTLYRKIKEYCLTD
jgi:transcriptional regulator with PAS, ATPase and Fis domain